MSFPVAFQIFEGVFQFDAVILEKAIQLHAGLVTEEAAELCGRELVLAVSFEGDGFHGRAGEVLAGGSQDRGKLVGKIERKMHGASIPEKGGKCIRNQPTALFKDTIPKAFGLEFAQPS
jgi:hypothetical protein